MGGNALKHLGVTRKLRREYLAQEAAVRRMLENCENIGKFYVPRYFADKESFGDMDIVFVAKDERLKTEELVGLLFPASKGMVKNGDVVSVEHEAFQLDFIRRSNEYFESTCAYFDFGVFGNIVGMVVCRHGLVFSDRGLYLQCRAPEVQGESDHIGQNDDASGKGNETSKVRDRDGNDLGKVLLSSCPEKILPFLGLDFARFSAGFVTLSELFALLADMRFFDASRFANLHTQNMKLRSKARRRPDIEQFVVFCENLQDRAAAAPALTASTNTSTSVDTGTVSSYDTSGSVHEVVQTEALQVFGKQAAFLYLCEQRRRRRAVAARFSGHLVMQQFSDLQGARLGHFIAAFKAWAVQGVAPASEREGGRAERRQSEVEVGVQRSFDGGCRCGRAAQGVGELSGIAVAVRAGLTIL